MLLSSSGSGYSEERKTSRQQRIKEKANENPQPSQAQLGIDHQAEDKKYGSAFAIFGKGGEGHDEFRVWAVCIKL